jgi:aminopeptidase N
VRHALWALCTGLWLALVPVMVTAQTGGWQPRHFALELEPDFDARRFAATVQIDLVAGPHAPTTLTLQAGALAMDQVRLGQTDLAFERDGAQLHIHLPDTVTATGGMQTLTLRYRGQGSAGLRFDPDTPQVATAFSTSQWMPCLDDPAVRATFNLRLVLPSGLISVSNGRRTETAQTRAGARVDEWHLDTPMPNYLYGFAAGRFTQSESQAGATRLTYLGPAGLFDEAALQRVFHDTADQLAFYAERAGVPYALPVYGQVLQMGPVAQEMAGFSAMGARYGTRVLADPEAIWLGAHEAAHQWWGNGLTNRSWRHFWLNEGIASFMTTAYLEHRFGRAAYDEQIAAARTKYDALRAQGLDKPLVFPDWDHPTAADRSLVYDKGTLVLHELRKLLGEERFWKGLKHYTRKHWGQSVETADFKRAMEEGSGADLSAFFRQWVEAQ